MARWKKWAIAVPLIIGPVSALTVIALWVWERQAQRALAEVVEQIRATGAPVYLADLIPPPVPDEQNAALPLREAARLVERQVEEMSSDYWGWDMRLPLREEEEAAAMRQLVEQNMEAWSHLEEARRREQVRWPIELTSPLLLMALPDLNEQRALARFVQWAAYLAHHDGDYELALRRLEYLPVIAEAVDQLPMMVAHMVAVGIWALHMEGITEMAPELHVGDGEGGAAASTARVRTGVDRLLNDEPPSSGTRRAFEAERVSTLDSYRGLIDGSFSKEHSHARRSMRPMLLANARLTLSHLTHILDTLDRSTNWPMFQRELPRNILQLVEQNERYELTAMLVPSFERVVVNHYRILTDRRLAACALAVRWYAAEHEGRLPESLEELVPRYLPHVPLDPMDGGGGMIRYLPQADPPILYSVGENGIDNGGSTRPTEPTWRGDVHRWAMQDAVVHLKRQPRPEPEEEPW